jgi:hypothetical protein
MVASTSKKPVRKAPRPILKQAVLRSKLEDRIAEQLEESGLTYGYEVLKLTYEIPARRARYTPDFIIGAEGKPPLVIEAKGYMRPKDRQLLLLIKEQNPALDIRVVFQRASNKIHKNSPTTYAAWCDAHGIRWADGGVIPEAWLDEIRETGRS